MRRLLPASALLACAIVLSLPTISAQIVPPPTLTGETLNAGFGSQTFSTSSSCDPSNTSTFSYQTSGTATGPYPGTFIETGTVTIGPQVFPSGQSAPSGPVTSWTASFTITTPTGEIVTGTKTLTLPPPGGGPPVTGICTNGSATFGAEQAANTAGSAQSLAYTATISVPGGDQFRDTGTSQASVSVTPATPQANNFSETFASQQSITIALCDENSETNQNQDDDDQGCVNP